MIIQNITKYDINEDNGAREYRGSLVRLEDELTPHEAIDKGAFLMRYIKEEYVHDDMVSINFCNKELKNGYSFNIDTTKEEPYEEVFSPVTKLDKVTTITINIETGD